MTAELANRFGQQVALRLSDGTIRRGQIGRVSNGCVVLINAFEVTSYTVAGVTNGLNWTGVPLLIQIDQICAAWQPTWA